MKVLDRILLLLISLILVSTGFAQHSKLSVYGYFDLEAEVNNKDIPGKRWTFDLHHFNVITVYKLDKHFRVFSEIEWEHGVSLKRNGTSGSSEGNGLVTLERGWAEYKYNDALKIKFGKMLTPFGIYNLKHDASPTFLATFLPEVIYGKHSLAGQKQRLYAKFSTGIQVLGSLMENGFYGEYHLLLSNGRGPKPSEADNNSNKAIAAQIRFTPMLDPLALGASFYRERNGQAYHARQTALGVDLTLTSGNALLESEFIIYEFENIKEISPNQFEPAKTFFKGNGYYVQGAYTFFDSLTPFGRYEYFDPDLGRIDDAEMTIVAGLNIAVTPRVYLKGEVQALRFQNAARPDYEKLISSVAIAF